MGTFLAETPENLKAAYFTLGCKLNYAETSTIGRLLKERGIEEIKKGEVPGICIVNTCSVTETADKKARSLIRRIARTYPDALLVVTGCYAQLKPQEVASIEGVDLVLGSKEKLRIAEFLEGLQKKDAPRVESGAIDDATFFSPSCSRGDRTRFFLKVQDGCDYYCTYCTIPFARGRSRNGSVSSLVSQARQAAEEGGKEIVITGVNIGDFGKTTGESFFDLIKALDRVEGIERFRISSIEPNLLTDEIIEWIASESRAYMPHFHIPLQSGSDTVLKIMNRRYSASLFAERIFKIKSLIPDAFIGVDVIAGARGESADEWNASYSFIESLPVSRLHVFPYSERPGTVALRLNNYVVSHEERNIRAERLIKLSDIKIHDFMEKNKGMRRKVLWEHPISDSKEDGPMMSGLTDNYIRVVAPLKEELLNQISDVVLEGIDSSRQETMRALLI